MTGCEKWNLKSEVFLSFTKYTFIELYYLYSIVFCHYVWPVIPSFSHSKTITRLTFVLQHFVSCFQIFHKLTSRTFQTLFKTDLIKWFPKWMLSPLCGPHLIGMLTRECKPWNRTVSLLSFFVKHVSNLFCYRWKGRGSGYVLLEVMGTILKWLLLPYKICQW